MNSELSLLYKILFNDIKVDLMINKMFYPIIVAKSAAISTVRIAALS